MTTAPTTPEQAASFVMPAGKHPAGPSWKSIWGGSPLLRWVAKPGRGTTSANPGCVLVYLRAYPNGRR